MEGSKGNAGSRGWGWDGKIGKSNSKEPNKKGNGPEQRKQPNNERIKQRNYKRTESIRKKELLLSPDPSAFLDIKRQPMGTVVRAIADSSNANPYKHLHQMPSFPVAEVTRVSPNSADALESRVNTIHGRSSKKTSTNNMEITSTVKWIAPPKPQCSTPSPVNVDVQSEFNKAEGPERRPYDQRPNVKRKASALERAKFEYRSQTNRKVAELQRRNAEKESKRQKMEENIAKRKQNFKVYSKKTRKGQPVMADRMNLLLQQIEKECLKEKSSSQGPS